MPKLTKEKYEEWSAKAPMGWSIDIEDYVLYGDKNLVKRVLVKEGQHIQYKLTWKEKLETKVSPYGCKYTIGTNTYAPTLYVDKLTESTTKGIYYVTTILETTLGEAQPKKSFSALCKLYATMAEMVNL